MRIFVIVAILAVLLGRANAAAPARVEATTGDVTVVFESKRQWTPARIDFRGRAMTTERSAYGTVFSFPNVGFIGTAHLENEPEQLQSTAWWTDGVKVEPGKTLEAKKKFRFVRKSRIRAFETESEWRIQNQRLYETVDVHATAETPLTLVYHFMHAWRPSVSEFIAGRDDGTAELGDQLRDDKSVARKFYIERPIDWMAVYEPESRQFAVSRLLEVPAAGGARSRIWNVPGAYRKYYLMCFHKQTVPEGWRGRYRMVTGFGAAAAGDWGAAARRLADELQER